MSSDKHDPVKSKSGTRHEPARPEADREPGEQARTDNTVAAKDAFGAPRKDAAWSREAITTQTVKPALDGSDDTVRKEQAKNVKQ